jgi:hypothetical protein
MTKSNSRKMPDELRKFKAERELNFFHKTIRNDELLNFMKYYIQKLLVLFEEYNQNTKFINNEFIREIKYSIEIIGKYYSKEQSVISDFNTKLETIIENKKNAKN